MAKLILSNSTEIAKNLAVDKEFQCHRKFYSSNGYDVQMLTYNFSAGDYTKKAVINTPFGEWYEAVPNELAEYDSEITFQKNILNKLIENCMPMAV